MQKSDVSEAQAIDAVFGSQQVPVTAFKWAMGHTLCASGLLDAVLTTYALRERCVPGIATLDALARACDSLDARRESRDLAEDKRYAMLINRGFSSMNACLVLKACD